MAVKGGRVVVVEGASLQGLFDAKVSKSTQVSEQHVLFL